MKDKRGYDIGTSVKIKDSTMETLKRLKSKYKISLKELVDMAIQMYAQVLDYRDKTSIEDTLRELRVIDTDNMKK